MSKKILITCTDSMMKQFLEPHVINLVDKGYDVEIACSEVLDRFNEVQDDLGKLVKIHKLSLKRSPLSLFAHVKGYRELKQIIDGGLFDIIWTNEPVMGVITRLAAREARNKGTRVLYMVHGFHFFKGAPIFNWLFFYPIERMMAPKADCICTINREDYSMARNMRVKRVEYVHGVGINSDRLRKNGETKLKEEIGLKKDDFIVVSVGELNRNKNQKVIIKAISMIPDSSIHYVLCGKGDQRKHLEKLAEKLGTKDRIHFLGYRKDVVDICSQSDVFAMPSKREGLPVASLEAMYCGLPLVNSNIRGLSDVTKDGVTGFVCSPSDTIRYAKGIKKLKSNDALRLKFGLKNKEIVKPFCLQNSLSEVLKIVESL